MIREVVKSLPLNCQKCALGSILPAIVAAECDLMELCSNDGTNSPKDGIWVKGKLIFFLIFSTAVNLLKVSFVTL